MYTVSISINTKRDLYLFRFAAINYTPNHVPVLDVANYL